MQKWEAGMSLNGVLGVGTQENTQVSGWSGWKSKKRREGTPCFAHASIVNAAPRTCF